MKINLYVLGLAKEKQFIQNRFLAFHALNFLIETPNKPIEYFLSTFLFNWL